ncbi:MAG: hypothetical protein ACXWAT_00145 [Methylobacter sp.]
MILPKCPHCEHEFNDEQIWHGGNRCKFPTERDGDESEFNCPSCFERLYVELEFTPSWHFKDEDGDDIF